MARSLGSSAVGDDALRGEPGGVHLDDPGHEFVEPVGVFVAHLPDQDLREGVPKGVEVQDVPARRS